MSGVGGSEQVLCIFQNLPDRPDMLPQTSTFTLHHIMFPVPIIRYRNATNWWFIIAGSFTLLSVDSVAELASLLSKLCVGK